MGHTASASAIAPSDLPAAAAYRDAIRAFGEIAGAITKPHEQDALLRLIGRRTCELVGVARCSVYLYDPQSALLRGQVGWTTGADTREMDVRIKRLVAGTEADMFTREILETRGPVVVADAAADPRPIRSTMRAWGVRSMLGVPMTVRDEIIGVIFLDEADRPHVFTEAEIEVASTFAELAAVAVSEAQLTTHLRGSLRTVARQNELLRRASATDEQLNELVVEGGNVGDIAQAVADLTGKPCEVYDSQHVRLAVGVPQGGHGLTPPGLDAQMRAMPAVRDDLARLKPNETGVVGPHPDAGLTHRCLVGAVTTRGERWGSVVVIEFGARLSALDTHIVRRAAMNVALEMSAERRAARAELDARASLAAELIRGSSDAAKLRRRSEFLGIDLTAPHAVCLVGTNGPSGLPTGQTLAAAAARGFETAAVLSTAVAEGLVLIVPLDPHLSSLDAIAATRRRMNHVLEDLSWSQPLLVGIGAPSHDVEGYARAYGEARGVLECLRSFSIGERSLILTANELGPGRLLLASATREDAERFARDTLGPLLTENGAMLDLFETVRVFFDNSRSIRRSAQHLGLHENTIRYRLARIHELTGLAIGSNSDDELTAHLALLILRIQAYTSGHDSGPPSDSGHAVLADSS